MPLLLFWGERATEKALIELRQEMGLDKPLYYQYAKFLWDNRTPRFLAALLRQNNP